MIYFVYVVGAILWFIMGLITMGLLSAVLNDTSDYFIVVFAVPCLFLWAIILPIALFVYIARILKEII